jgi:hypothetical protein
MFQASRYALRPRFMLEHALAVVVVVVGARDFSRGRRGIAGCSAVVLRLWLRLRCCDDIWSWQQGI